MCRPEPRAGGHTLNYFSRGVADVPWFISTSSSFALSVQNGRSVWGEGSGQWSRPELTGWRGNETDSFEPLNLHLLARDCMKSSGCLIDGYSLYSLTRSPPLWPLIVRADTGFPCPAHLGEFGSQSSVTHSAMLPGNSGKKEKKFCQFIIF